MNLDIITQKIVYAEKMENFYQKPIKSLQIKKIMMKSFKKVAMGTRKSKK